MGGDAFFERSGFKTAALPWREESAASESPAKGHRDRKNATGVSLIYVSETTSDNMIACVPGANMMPFRRAWNGWGWIMWICT